MTRPIPAQTTQSEAARVPRVSDEDIALTLQGQCAGNELALAADCQEHRATIADLERRLAQMERASRSKGQKLGIAERAETMLNLRCNSLTQERNDERARADALQAQLTEAEQRAATAERRGFEAGRDAAAGVASQYKDTCAMCEADPIFGADPEAYAQRGRAAQQIEERVRALAPAVPQEGETTR